MQLTDNKRIPLVWIVFILFLSVMLVFAPASEAKKKKKKKVAQKVLTGETFLKGAHADEDLLPRTCRACHKGMTMGIKGEEGVCLSCHGDQGTQQAMVTNGLLGLPMGQYLGDIRTELQKPYNHPVLEYAGIHRKLETLPEQLTNAARHSECVDCHDPHVVEKDRPFVGLRGKRVGNFMTAIEFEYELCYKCHAESANLPGDSTNKHAEFSENNPSYHPVEGEGRNTYVISLLEPYAARAEEADDVSRISCRDCHGSDDESGPRGPHGSRYKGLLVRNYQMDDGLPESSFAYALCYECHDRRSILNNDSFAYHALHIEGPGLGGDGTSCFTCHDAHGSSKYQYLIRFNEDVVVENAQGRLEFKAQGVGSRHGSCSLNCHGVEHDQREY